MLLCLGARYRLIWITRCCRLVPGSSHVEDALGDTIPPAPPVLRSLFNLPIFLRSFLTTSFHFCRSRPGLLLKPSGSHARVCRWSLWWSIRERCLSHLRRLHLIMSSSFGSAVVSPTFSFVTLSFQETPRMLRCHVVVVVVLYSPNNRQYWTAENTTYGGLPVKHTLI